MRHRLVAAMENPTMTDRATERLARILYYQVMREASESPLLTPWREGPWIEAAEAASYVLRTALTPSRVLAAWEEEPP